MQRSQCCRYFTGPEEGDHEGATILLLLNPVPLAADGPFAGYWLVLLVAILTYIGLALRLSTFRRYCLRVRLCSGSRPFSVGDSVTIFGSSTDLGGDQIWASWDKWARKDVLVDTKCSAFGGHKGLHGQVWLSLDNSLIY